MMPTKNAVKWLTGQYYERKVLWFLRRQGLTFIDRNVRNQGGEIDLIMQDKAYWVFIEVRFRQCHDYGGALLSVTKQKQKKILTTARYWLAQQNESFDTRLCRFDICAITDQQFEWVQNAFTTE